MADVPRFYLTTAIDYPNSRPHIGTAFEKIGADVQARYRRMEGYDVHFLMGNDENTPGLIQPESRRNEIVSLVQTELKDVNITRLGQKWGIRVPFDEEYTIYVWFDALLNYITAIGYGTDEERFRTWWPADMHFIGKDITRFHCALWPAMCFAAGIAPPKRVFGHGFVYIKGEKISKSLGNVIEPMDII